MLRASWRDSMPHPRLAVSTPYSLMVLSPDNFERLLNWLHPNRDEAGQEYQRIRALLIRKFQAKDSPIPDRLADLTMDRAAEKLTTEKMENWIGPKERYFLRVAHYILLEDSGRTYRETQMPDGLVAWTAYEEEDLELKFHCLGKCLDELTPVKRELIVKYFRGEKGGRVKNRMELARDLNVTSSALRIRAAHIMLELKPCIEKCLSNTIDTLPAILMQAVVSLGEKTPEGHRIQAVTLPWFTLIEEIQRDARYLTQIDWRKLEELVAGAYERAGYEVLLTPRSADRGRDIVAVKHGVCSIRIIDQVKAYAPHRRVTANDVRALIGVLASEQNTSKGIVTTTAAFAPGIWNDPTIKPFIPYRLELRDGEQLRRWLLDLAIRRDV
jgi:restriction system protein